MRKQRELILKGAEKHLTLCSNKAEKGNLEGAMLVMSPQLTVTQFTGPLDPQYFGLCNMI